MIKISDAEFEVMKILWKRDEATSIDIIQELRNEKSWSENTIRTLITRLQNKNAIEIVKKEGKTYTYKSILKENEYKLKESKSFLAKMYNGSINNLLLNFVQEKELTEKDIEDLKKLIDKK